MNALNSEQQKALIQTLKTRFEKNLNRHPNLDWINIQEKLQNQAQKLHSLFQMEITEGEPDVVVFDENSNDLVFVDCSPESPKGRRSFCYDQQALESRKENKPKNSVLGWLSEFNLELIDELEYKKLQGLGEFDLKTSSWLKTPNEIRKLGGALFGDKRFNTVFTYHNGAESYYAARAFRAKLII